MKNKRICNVSRMLILVVAPLCAPALWASNLPPQLAPQPGQLIQKVVENELKAEAAEHSSWRYLDQRYEDKKSETLDVVGTPDGYVYRTIDINGEAPNADAECRRVTKLLSDPAELEHAWKSQQSDAEKLRTLMRMMPNAFLYRYDGRYDRGPVPAGRVRLFFEPNPNFHPPSISAEVFPHLEGYVVVDMQAMRLVEINARLASTAKFGGGILGHLDSGGTVVYRQEDVGEGHWQPVFIDVNMHGRLLFMTLGLHQQNTYTEYEQIPDHLASKQIASLILNESYVENAALR